MNKLNNNLIKIIQDYLLPHQSHMKYIFSKTLRVIEKYNFFLYNENSNSIFMFQPIKLIYYKYLL